MPTVFSLRDVLKVLWAVIRLVPVYVIGVQALWAWSKKDFRDKLVYRACPTLAPQHDSPVPITRTQLWRQYATNTGTTPRPGTTNAAVIGDLVRARPIGLPDLGELDNTAHFAASLARNQRPRRPQLDASVLSRCTSHEIGSTSFPVTKLLGRSGAWQ